MAPRVTHPSLLSGVCMKRKAALRCKEIFGFTLPDSKGCGVKFFLVGEFDLTSEDSICKTPLCWLKGGTSDAQAQNEPLQRVESGLLLYGKWVSGLRMEQHLQTYTHRGGRRAATGATFWKHLARFEAISIACRLPAERTADTSTSLLSKQTHVRVREKEREHMLLAAEARLSLGLTATVRWKAEE